MPHLSFYLDGPTISATNTWWHLQIPFRSVRQRCFLFHAHGGIVVHVFRCERDLSSGVAKRCNNEIFVALRKRWRVHFFSLGEWMAA